MADICQFVCSYRTPSGYCGSTGGYATCQHRKIDEPPTIKSAEPMTNADRIRHMSDEELAEYLNNKLDTCCGNKPCDWPDPNTNCDTCWLDWLKQEVQDAAD